MIEFSDGIFIYGGGTYAVNVTLKSIEECMKTYTSACNTTITKQKDLNTNLKVKEADKIMSIIDLIIKARKSLTNTAD